MRDNLYHIGRDKFDNEIYIINDSVSSTHAQVLIDENSDVVIIDLSSKNGVYVNDTKIESPVKLKTGDVITLGDFSFTNKDLLHAIRVFDYKQNLSKEKNVPLNSSIQENSKPLKKKLMTKKSLFIMLIALGLVITAFGANYFVKQNAIKRNFEKNIKKDKADNSKEADIDETEETVKIEKKETENTTTTTNNQNNKRKQRTDVTYDFSCLATEGDGGSNETIFVFGELTRNVQNSILKDVEISIKDEKEAGNKLVEKLKEEKKFITHGSDFNKLNRIMKDLIFRLADPRGVEYDMYFVDDTIKNVFTLGGNIIFYKGMYDFCISESELAAIISHEIAHNELGHSTLAFKKQRVANNFGIFGNFALLFESMASTSFNQKQETEADMFGMDLVFPTNYKNCASVSLWKRMSKNENDFHAAENFFRSHPYSKNRSLCLKRHLKTNYNMHCN